MQAPAQDTSYDYVVIGGGSAGCVVAARLAAEQGGSVLLVEASDPAERNPESLSADGFKYAFGNDRMMWHRMTAKQASCGGRSLYAGTGRGMGGSGSVNGMVYTRGDRRDFAAWPEGWRWDDVEPAFRGLEQRLRVRPRAPTPFVKAFIDASVAAGFRHKDGLNDGDLGGYVGANDMNYEGENRRSSYRAFIHDGKPANLAVATGLQVRGIKFDGNRAVGVEVVDAGADGTTPAGTTARTIGVRREVVLAAGALETPRLLLLSGVGPRAQLEALGIRVVHDAPGVGANLQDHPNASMFFRSKEVPDFGYPQVYGFDAARRAPDAPHDAAPDTCFVCYAAPGSMKESMLRMVPVLALPGKLHNVRWLRGLMRGLVELLFKFGFVRRGVSKLFGVVVILGKPTSRGSITLTSADPAAPPRVDPNYFATQHDRETMMAGIAKARGIVEQAPMRAVGAELLSRPAANADAQKVWKWIVGAAMTTFHFCSSVRMGRDAADPVDLRLRLKGLQNVRVADASVFPDIPVSALNAPSMMVGWRAAGFIVEDHAAGAARTSAAPARTTA